MSLHRVFDAAFPPQTAPPGCTGVLGYLGGARATNVWTLEQWQRFASLAQFPAWVPEFTAETPLSSARNACTAMESFGWAPGQADTRALVCDLETAEDPQWYAAFAGEVSRRGFLAVAYGSLSTVGANFAADVWAAAWDGSATLPLGQTIHAHQYTAGITLPGKLAIVDYSVVDDWLMARAGRGPRHA